MIATLTKVSLAYGPRLVLRAVDAELQAGGFYFLTGPSGSGKSSLLKMLHGTLRPTAGLVKVLDQDLTHLTDNERANLRRKVGMVFQDSKILAHASVFDNVALSLRLAGATEKQIRDNVPEMLRWIGLAHASHLSPSVLSGGEQQRVAIARAVITRPKLLLADEPTGNVDDTTGFKLLRLFEEINKLGTTIVLATHNQALLTRLRYPTLIIEQGTLRLQPPTVVAAA